MTNTNCWATFIGENGYPLQIEMARNKLVIGETYKVIGGEVGGWSTSLELEGVEGSFNSVMFVIEGQLPSNVKPSYYINK